MSRDQEKVGKLNSNDIFLIRAIEAHALVVQEAQAD